MVNIFHLKLNESKANKLCCQESCDKAGLKSSLTKPTKRFLINGYINQIKHNKIIWNKTTSHFTRYLFNEFELNHNQTICSVYGTSFFTDLDDAVQEKGLDAILDEERKSSNQVAPFTRSFHTSESRTVIRRADGVRCLRSV